MDRQVYFDQINQIWVGHILSDYILFSIKFDLYQRFTVNNLVNILTTKSPGKFVW